MPEIKWIKITTDLPDDEKIKIIDTMPDRDAIWVIWIKLIIQAGKCNDGGYIWLSPNKPFTEEILATIFNRPVNTLRLALKVFIELEMLEVKENGLMYLYNFEKHQNIEGMERMRQLATERQRKHRAIIKASNTQLALESGSHVTSRDSHAVDKNRIDKNRIDKIREEDLYKIWDDVLTKIKERANGPNFKTYWEKLAPVEITETEFTIGSSYEHVCCYIETNAISLLEKAIDEVTGKDLKARLVLVEKGDNE